MYSQAWAWFQIQCHAYYLFMNPCVSRASKKGQESHTSYKQFVFYKLARVWGIRPPLPYKTIRTYSLFFLTLRTWA